MLETKPNPPITNPIHCHGDGRARTDDPLLAKQVLSQLSYAPAVASRPSSDQPQKHRRNQPPTLTTDA